MTKKTLRQKIEVIAEMENTKLGLYVREIHMSMLDRKAKDFLLRACDIRHMQLREETTLSPLVVMSEMNEDELV